MNMFFAIVFYAIGLVIAYFVIRLAVCHGINDSNLFSLNHRVETRGNIIEAINQSEVKKDGKGEE